MQKLSKCRFKEPRKSGDNLTIKVPTTITIDLNELLLDV